jgi:hypothetical protein
MNTETDKKIVKLNDFKKNVSFPAIKEVEAYWEGLRAGRSMPMRSEVNPRGIESALENAFILERIAPGMARFRLAGAHLTDLMGMEVRGMPFTSFFTPDARKEAGATLEAVFQNPEVAEITVTSEAGIGKPALAGKIILLPLKSDLGDVTRILGCFVTEGDIGRGPRRFGLTERKMTRIIGAVTPLAAQTPTKTETPARPVPPAAKKTELEKIPGFAEAKANFEPAPTSKKGRPNLRLLKFDD